MVVSIILTVLVLGLFVASILLDKHERPVTVFWGIFFTLLLGLVCAVSMHQGTYKDGQIDAMKDVIKYERRFVIPEGDTVITDTLYFEIK